MATAPAPETIGRYQVLGELGKGAMGIVYKAEDPTIGRIVALKTMRVDIHGIEAQEMLGRFRNEARAAGVLNHPNIVTVYDAGEETGHFYMALECIEGETVQEMMRARRVLPPELVVDMARQVCAGLDYAHAHGIIHRDIKPANIMITPAGTAKIMDFGIAKGTGVALTTTGQVMGTPNYMSPEQVRGRPIDGRSDLFSLGVVLYEALTGEKPFAGDNVTTVIYKIVNEEPLPPHELDISLHPGLSAVILKALAKIAELRYQRGADLAADLLNYRNLGFDTVPKLAVTPPPDAESPAAGVPMVVAPVPRRPAAAPSLPAVDSGADHETQAGTPLPPIAAPAAGGHKGLVMALVAVLAVAGILGALSGLRRYRAAHTVNPPVVQQPAVTPAQDEAASAASPAAGQQGDDKVIVHHYETLPEAAAAKTPGPSPTPATVAAKAPAKLRPAGSEGTLSLRSTPPGAHILLDGTDSGKLTPAQFQVVPGRHSVTLKLDGYKDVSSSAKLVAGQTYHFSPELEKAPTAAQTLATPFKKLFGGGIPEGKGQVEVKSRPKGAIIFVDGKRYDRPTPEKINLDPGSHTIAVQMEGYRPFSRQVQVEKGKSTKVETELKAK